MVCSSRQAILEDKLLKQRIKRSANISMDMLRKKKEGAKSCASFAIMESELYKILSGFFKDIVENLEDYVETFLRIYKESDRSAEAMRQVSGLKSNTGKGK